ncbi:MAG: AmmeMemoRadiSam system radical SAM enzyme [Candidatus Wallbacteria bacterium]
MLSENGFNIKPARHYKKIEGGNVRCELCPRRCVIKPDHTGFCKSRKNLSGELYTLNYGKVSALHIDPVEKKPLYHFYPGSSILSAGTNYCNLACRFCQNYELSQHDSDYNLVTPESMVALSKKSENCSMIAFTYNEPSIWYEFMYDTSVIARKSGVKTVMVTNGEINGPALDELAPYMDAMNIDLKGFSAKFYDEYCGGGSFETVLSTIKKAYSLGIHVEITNLVIPGLNDSPGMISDLIDFVAGVSPDIPLHFSKYHPAYMLDIPSTPVKTLIAAYEAASKKLKFVYAGNIVDTQRNSTFCPSCGAMLIERNGFDSVVTGLEKSTACCLKCGDLIYGKF